MGSALDGLISLPAFAPRSPASRVARTIAFAFVFVVALGVRLLYAGPAASACYGVEQDRYRIAHFYHQASADLADGDDRVVFPSGLEAGDTLVVGYPPGYFVFLAAVYRVSGSSMEAALVAQCVIDALTCVVLVLLGEALFSLGVGTVAGLLMAVSPQFAALSVVLKPDTLTVLPVLLALLLVVVAARRDDLRLWICAGLSLGLACWFRQNALLLAPVIAAAGCLLASDGPRRAVRGAVALTVATFVCVLPLTVRNVALYGEAIPVTTGSGFALLSGLARDDIEGRYGLSRFAYNVSIEEAEARGLASNTYFDEYDRMQSTHRRPFEVKHTVLSIFAVDGIARDRARRERASSLIRSDLPYFARVVTVRAKRLLGYSEQNRTVPVEARRADHAFESMAFTRTIGGDWSTSRHASASGAWTELVRAPLAALQRGFSTIVLAPLALLGLVLLAAGDWRRFVFVIAPVVYYVGLQSLMWAEFRHTLPIHASVFLAIGHAFSIGAGVTRRALQRR